ncbi:HI1506-related protein [Nitratidesulfovibrio liaohensis]|uniref:HI1506-related protein n=1 Tax=Nitratidesulfovibrio liaohensis TaxID=2604158 RepID=UPI0014207B19|nr:HI1506-related protein [Nitratidesulfovibrio liaohensis]NHZ48593.1 hypothetical protein [Nitratidesulfovibrio liaohensis]
MPTMIRITSKRDGFRRAGMAHSGTRDYPAGTFTDEQLEALTGESMLVVDEVDVPDLSDATDADAKPASPAKAARGGKPAGGGKGEPAKGNGGKDEGQEEDKTDTGANDKAEAAPQNTGDAPASGGQ